MSPTSTADRAPRDWWPLGPSLAIASGIAVLAVPAGLEGPTLWLHARHPASAG